MTWIFSTRIQASRTSSCAFMANSEVNDIHNTNSSWTTVMLFIGKGLRSLEKTRPIMVVMATIWAKGRVRANPKAARCGTIKAIQAHRYAPTRGLRSANGSAPRMIAVIRISRIATYASLKAAGPPAICLNKSSCASVVACQLNPCA